MALARITLTSLLACAALACGPVEDGESPEFDTRTAAQVSGGVGWSVYQFKANGAHIGRVLVTDGAFGDGYGNQTEYWLWEPQKAAQLRAGQVNTLEIDIVVQEEAWKGDLAAQHFESGTTGWTAFAIPRSFDLDGMPRLVYSSNYLERQLYAVEASAWGGMTGSIRYYLRFDFTPGSDIPSMEWYVDVDDIKTYYYSEDGDDDDDEGEEGGGDNWDYFDLPLEVFDDAQRWEVRLEQDATAHRVSYGYGYELTTLYPAQ